MHIITPYIPFPNIHWWSLVIGNTVLLDGFEHFEKMTYRNKYFISGANGGIQLSIPLRGGREQRTLMKDVMIDNTQRWQVQHWRTLVSVYKRTPFFEYYEPLLQLLFEQSFESLIDFNAASIHWLKKQLSISFQESATVAYQKAYDGVFDIRNNAKPRVEKGSSKEELYYQVFADRNGFIPNLSVLDLLFSDGPNAMNWIIDNMGVIKGWKED